MLILETDALWFPSSDFCVLGFYGLKDIKFSISLNVPNCKDFFYVPFMASIILTVANVLATS